jgi:hypothetical protein
VVRYWHLLNHGKGDSALFAGRDDVDLLIGAEIRASQVTGLPVKGWGHPKSTSGAGPSHG